MCNSYESETERLHTMRKIVKDQVDTCTDVKSLDWICTYLIRKNNNKIII